MKTIGIVGGTGWVSSADYYKIINLEVNKRLGGLNFAKLILYSLNYAEIAEFNKTKNYDGVYGLVRNGALILENSGADCILLGANTLHYFAERLQPELKIPIIHIADSVGKKLKQAGIKTTALLGTKQTMESEFYKNKLEDYGIKTIIPEADQRDFINSTIMDELLKSIFSENSRNKFSNIIDTLKEKGSEAVILGCTEIPLLINQNHSSLPVINSTEAHADDAVNFALENGE